MDKKADYLLAVKENQKELYRDIADTFRFSKPVEVIRDIDVGHGRVETRKCTIVNDLSHIESRDDWKGSKRWLSWKVNDILSLPGRKKLLSYIISPVKWLPQCISNKTSAHTGQ